MARDSRMMSQPAFAEGQMQAAPNLSPAQLFESARRAAQDGQLALAEQFLRHILAVAPGSPEGAAAQTELGRLMRHRAAVEQAQPAQVPQPQLPQAQPQQYVDPNFGAPQQQWSDATQTTGRPGPFGPAPQPTLGAPAVQPAYYQPDTRPQAPMSTFEGVTPGDGNDRLPTVVTGGRKAKKKAQEPAPAPAAAEGVMLDPPRSYGFGRFLAALVGLIGWLATLGGLAALGASAAALLKLKLPFLPLIAIGFVPAGQIVAMGLALILIRHIARATFDASSHAYAAAAYAQATAQAQQDR
jgi:hypothetical protein